MTWTNAFDIGACTVTIEGAGLSATVWSGVLAKGQSSPEMTTTLNDVVQAVVNSDGSVQLNWISGSGGGPLAGYQLSVIPSYDVSNPTLGLRVRGISIPSGVSGKAQAFSNDAGSTPVTLTTSDHVTWSPDPAVITTDLPHAGFFVYAGAVV